MNPFRTWAFHNLVAHPVSEVVWWLKFFYAPCRRWSGWIHDATLPENPTEEGRG